MNDDRLREKQKRRLERELKPLCKAERRATQSKSRYAPEIYLREVLRLYECWSRIGLATRYSRRALKLAALPIRDVHPVRRLIDCTSTEPDRKRRSRWGRALQYAIQQKIESKRLRKFLRKNGGIAGCAHKAAAAQPRR
jgi:hypothetical protein